METYQQPKFLNRIWKLLNSLFLLLFLPVLFCVLFIGNYINYWDSAKADILLPNIVLTLIALVPLGICLRLLGSAKKIRLTKQTGRYLDMLLLVLFIGFYFLCLLLTRETAFDMSVDQGIVREAAKDVAHKIPFGYQFTFSMNHNNLPITYVLGRLYRLAEGWSWFSHDPEYLWLITGCLMVTAAGFFSCEIVKKITGNPAAVLISFLLYLATAGLSPWKTIPYTDSYGILFPVLCIWLYLCSRDCKRAAGQLSLLALSLLSGVVGGFMKPSAYIAVLAVLGVEGIHFLTNLRKEKKPYNALLRITFCLGCAVLLYVGAGNCKNYIVKDIGLDYNEEIEATVQYFFFIGTKELTTGSFSSEDFNIFPEFQFSKADRNAACMERAFERIRERGFFGTIGFCLKKLVKSFNDGTFAWTTVLFYEPFPEGLYHLNVPAGYLRSLLMPGGANQAKYDTLAELIWIFTLISIPGITLFRKKRESFVIFPILVIGILVYLILFESGARYIYIFLPLFTAMSVCGMDEMEPYLTKVIQKRKDNCLEH